MGKKVVKTLYFVTGPAPTEEQQLEIDAISGTVCVRNAAKIREDESLEDFDHVAGDVPDRYARAAAKKAKEAEAGPAAPKASASAPAAPQQAKAGTAKATGGAGGDGWKPN